MVRCMITLVGLAKSDLPDPQWLFHISGLFENAYKELGFLLQCKCVFTPSAGSKLDLKLSNILNYGVRLLSATCLILIVVLIQGFMSSAAYILLLYILIHMAQ